MGRSEGNDGSRVTQKKNVMCRPEQRITHWAKICKRAAAADLQLEEREGFTRMTFRRVKAMAKKRRGPGRAGGRAMWGGEGQGKKGISAIS